MPLAAASAALTAIAVGGAGTLGWWNDTATATGATLGAGNLDLTVGGAQGNPAAYSWTALAASGLAPGESVAAQVSMANAGTTPFTLTATGTGTGTLLPYATVAVTDGGSASNSGSAYPRTGSCTGGTATWSGTLTTGSTAVTLTSAAVAAAATRTLCVVVSLPGTTANAAQGTSGTVAFTLTATQVAP